MTPYTQLTHNTDIALVIMFLFFAGDGCANIDDSMCSPNRDTASSLEHWLELELRFEREHGT
jgi:hypothetical protein